MADNIYLEIDKSNGAILSYSNEKLQSSTSNFIEATAVELNYLNHLETNVLPAGMVTTLADLQDYRAKVTKIAQLKFQIAQNAGQVAKLRVELAKGEAAERAAKISRDAILAKAAAERGLSVPELESALAAFNARTEVPKTKSSEDAGYKLRKMLADSKRNRNNQLTNKV
jgi:predicted DsbA family dithiol-disulfide isomerase